MNHEEYQLRCDFIETFAREPAINLFIQMQRKAKAEPAYKISLTDWIKHGSTILLKDLVRPFADLWPQNNSCEFTNRWAELDSLHLHMQTWFARLREEGIPS
jgi:hypothetical protein